MLFFAAGSKEVPGRSLKYRSNASCIFSGFFRLLWHSVAGWLRKGSLMAEQTEHSRTAVADMACFGPGTIITTQNGEIPVEWLATDDKVLTRDYGFQPILWIGRSKLPPAHFEEFPLQAPISIPAAVLGSGSPTHDLCVAGNHRILIRSPQAELLFFSGEVLAPAAAWVEAGLARPVQPDTSVTMTSVLCAAHQIIVAQGAWVETTCPSRAVLRGMKPRDALHLEHLIGTRLATMQTARPCLTDAEACLLLLEQAASRAVADPHPIARRA